MSCQSFTKDAYLVKYITVIHIQIRLNLPSEKGFKCMIFDQNLVMFSFCGPKVASHQNQNHSKAKLGSINLTLQYCRLKLYSGIQLNFVIKQYKVVQ